VEGGEPAAKENLRFPNVKTKLANIFKEEKWKKS
jgi:hypothetical protein